ncbi:MAG: BrnT family toxin [Stenomitos frigidus ULC029]
MEVQRFEWDEAKAQRNFVNHGISFPEAQTVFNDPLFLIFHDPDHSIQEQRFLILGESSRGNLLVVSYTERAEVIRLISARIASRRERRDYENEL